MTVRKLLLAALLLTWPSLALADRDAPVQVASMLQAIVNDGGTAAGGFTGPGDILAATNFWSMGCYKGGYVGKAFQLWRDSTTTTQDFSCQSNGQVASAAAFCAATTCRLNKVYDQIGTCDLTSAHALSINMAPIVLSGLNSQPYVDFAANGDRLDSSCSTSNTVPYSVYNVANQTSSSGFALVWSSQTDWTGYNGASTAEIGSGSAFTATASGSAFHDITYIFNGASSSIVVDGTTTTGNTGSNTVVTHHCLGGNFSCTGNSQVFVGRWVETYFISGTALSGTQITNLTNNVRGSARWNF